MRFQREFGYWLCFVALLLHGIWIPVCRGEEKMDVAALEALTGRWIALRSELAAEEQSWKQQERQWKREIALLEREIASRRESLAEDTGYLQDVERGQADLIASKDVATDALQEMASVVSRHEVKLRAVSSWIPQSLHAALGTGFRALPENDDVAARASVLRRLQTVLALYTQIESLHNNMHLVRELIPVREQKREVDVLYVGLARGFAVSARNDWAAIGTPSDTGWQWQEVPEEASRIRLAIRVLQREADLQLVPLLLGIAGEGGE